MVQTIDQTAQHRCVGSRNVLATMKATVLSLLAPQIASWQSAATNCRHLLLPYEWHAILQIARSRASYSTLTTKFNTGPYSGNVHVDLLMTLDA